MLGGFGYSNTEQKHPSQATFKARSKKQINKHLETHKTKSFNKPHSSDHIKWENGIFSILQWLNLPSESGDARIHLSSRTFLVLESNNLTWVMPSSHNSILNWGTRNVLQEITPKQIIERLLLWQLLSSLSMAPCIRAGKREKGWKSWYSGTGKQLPQKAIADLAAFTFCTGLMDGFPYLDGQG